MTRMPQTKLDAVMALIQSRLPQAVTLDEMADVAGFSPSRFLVLFRNTTGLSPHQFILRERLEKARTLLEETDLPLSAIANDCGFSDQSHLIRRFKRHTGYTPRQYRTMSHRDIHRAASRNRDAQDDRAARHADALNQRTQPSAQ